MDDFSNPNDGKGAGGADPLAALRAEIDGIDANLLELVARRLRLADQMVDLKNDPSGLPIRPGREIDLLRKLVAAAPAPVEPELIVEVWRALIAANLRRQRKFDVFTGGMRADPARLFDAARRHFGARTRIQHLGEPQAALQKVAEQPDRCVAVTPWPAAPGVGAWWPALTENRFNKLHLIAGLPIMGAADDTPEACVFAAVLPEPAGNDYSVLIVFDPHHRAQRAMAEVGLKGKEMARSEPRALIRVEGFVAVDDARAQNMLGHGLDGVRVLGSYARI